MVHNSGMPVPVVCPSCNKRFVVRPELAGRRVKCTGCGSAFEVPRPKDAPPPLDDLEVVEPSYDVAVAPAPAPRRGGAAAPPSPPPSAPMPAYAAPRPTPRAAPAEWTPWQRLIFRTGWQVMLFGAVSLVLPLFGLQFRKLQKAGVNSAAVGVGLIVVGALMCGGVLLRRAVGGAGFGRIPARALLIAVAAVPLTCVLFVVVGAWLNRPGRRVKGPPQHASRPGPVSPGRAPDGFSQAGRPGPGPGAFDPRASGAFGPGGAPPPPPGNPHQTLADKYGADRVATVVITGGGPPETPRRPGRSPLEALFADKVKPVLGRAGHQINTSRARDGRINLEAAPVDDLDTLVKALDVGTVTAIDREKRTITVEVDPKSLPADPQAPAAPF